MARITVEDCMENVNNRYELVMAATQRARQLFKGADSLVESSNRQIVTSLREIAAKKVVSHFASAPVDDAGEEDLGLMPN
jgi:DNA-directed RNA polymerase subunit omega